MQIILLDNFDSFTYNLYDYFFRCGQDCIVVRNDEWNDDLLNKGDGNAIVISPGPKSPLEAGCTMRVIENYHKEIPILGICLGFQALGMFFGADLVQSPNPKHGKTSTIRHGGQGLFKDLPYDTNVMRYHSLVLDHENFPDSLEVDATSLDDQQIMAFHHKQLPIHAVQFHPESILTENGLKMIQNWLNLNSI